MAGCNPDESNPDESIKSPTEGFKSFIVRGLGSMVEKWTSSNIDSSQKAGVFPYQF